MANTAHNVFRRGVTTMIGVGVPSFQFNEINRLEGPDDADGDHFSVSIHNIRLSCQKPGVRACRPVEHPGWHFKPSICLRLFQRAAEDDKTILVDGTMNANSATKPRMVSIKNLAKYGPVGVLKPRCTMTSERTSHWAKMRQSLARFRGPGTSNRFRFWAGSITTTSAFEFSAHTAKERSGNSSLFEEAQGSREFQLA